MSLNRRAFLSRVAGTAIGLATSVAAGQSQGIPIDQVSGEPIVRQEGFPVFSSEEYAQRLARARQEMAKRNIDLLYVTQPSNMCYLHGYACTWYRAASTSSWPPMAGTAIHIDKEDAA